MQATWVWSCAAATTEARGPLNLCSSTEKAQVPQGRAGTAPTTKKRAEARLSVQAVCMQSP